MTVKRTTLASFIVGDAGGFMVTLSRLDDGTYTVYTNEPLPATDTSDTVDLTARSTHEDLEVAKRTYAAAMADMVPKALASITR